MTQEQKEAEVGRVLLEIKKREEEIAFPLGRLRAIAAQLRGSAAALEAVYGSTDGFPALPNAYSRYNTSGPPTVGELPDVNEIGRLESEVRDHGRALTRLYTARSNYGL